MMPSGSSEPAPVVSPNPRQIAAATFTRPARRSGASMEKIGCILCGRANGPVSILENGYQGRRCTDCGLIYVSPRPTREEIRTLYSHDDANIPSIEHFYGARSQRLHARHTLELISRFIRPGKPHYSVLEIGTGAGYFLDEARQAGFAVCGIELSGVLAEFVRSKLGIPCEEVPLSEASFGGQAFDVIYHCDVMSHFPDPIGELERTRARLLPGGVLTFETGNVAEQDERSLRGLRTFQYPDHLFFYSERSIRSLLDRAGFQVLQVARYSLAAETALHRWTSRAKRHRGFRSTVAGPDGARTHTLPDGLDVGDGSSALRQWISGASQTLQFFCRYKIGALAPKGPRPQTLIATARKRA